MTLKVTSTGRLVVYALTGRLMSWNRQYLLYTPSINWDWVKGMLRLGRTIVVIYPGNVDHPEEFKEVLDEVLENTSVEEQR